MTKGRSFWASRETIDGMAWATFQYPDGPAGARQPYATMSEATRAEVTKAARKRTAELLPELTGLIAECFMLHGRLTGVFGTIKDSAQLSGMEALTLYAVVNSDKPVTVPQIGRALGHARQVIQRAARELERRGLVATQDNPGHKRAAFLVATEEGRALKASFDTAGQEVAQTLAGDMDIETVRAATEGLQRLRYNVELRARDLHAQGGTKRD